MEGASAPPELTAVALGLHGPALMEVMASYRHLLGFGFMIADGSRGRVWAGRSGAPRIAYRLVPADVRRLRQGLALLARLLFAAGACEVFTGVRGHLRLRATRAANTLDRAPLSARDLQLTAYHPLGTARMGADPSTSVLRDTHETHDVLNLYVVDGSAVSGPLVANPQLTIMAMALRAAEHVARRLEALPSAG